MEAPWPSFSVVSVDRIRHNPWNPNRMDPTMYRKELASIRKFGFIDPITVRKIGNQFEIIDGEHRWRAAKELGIKAVPVYDVGDISDADAKQLTIVMNETRGKPDAKKLGSVLRDLLDSVQKTDLLDLLPYSPPVFDRLAGLEEVEDWGLPPTPTSNGWVERVYRMPIDAAEVLDEALAKAKDGEDIQEWQAVERIAAEFLASP